MRYSFFLVLVVAISMLCGCNSLDALNVSLIHTERGKLTIIQSGEMHEIKQPTNATEAGKNLSDMLKGDPEIDVGGL